MNSSRMATYNYYKAVVWTAALMNKITTQLLRKNFNSNWYPQFSTLDPWKAHALTTTLESLFFLRQEIMKRRRLGPAGLHSNKSQEAPEKISPNQMRKAPEAASH